MDHQNVIWQADFLKNFFSQWLHCSGKQGRVASGRWYGVSGGARYSWFRVFVYLYNVVVYFLLGKTNLVAEAPSEGDKWKKGSEGNFTNMPSSTIRLSSTIPYLLFSSTSYSSSSSPFFSSSYSSCSSSFRRFFKPPGPPSFPAWTCRTGTGLLLPQVPKY